MKEGRTNEVIVNGFFSDDYFNFYLTIFQYLLFLLIDIKNQEKKATAGVNSRKIS